MSEDKQNKVSYDDEIDLIELAQRVWLKRVFIAKITGVFVLIGLVIAFTAKEEYTSNCKLLPENQEGGMGNLGSLGGLAGLAGIDLGSMSGSSGGLSPSLYPEIVQSAPFMFSVINEPIKFQILDTLVSPYQYFKEISSSGALTLLMEYTIGLPGKIKELISGKEVDESGSIDKEYIRLSKSQLNIIEETKERIKIETDSETGVISVEVEMPDPYAAAAVTNKVVNKLTSEVTSYKIEKVRTNLDFIQSRYEEAEKRYEEKQRLLAIYSDRNRNVTSSLVQTEKKRLENEVDIGFEVYKGLASQLEQAKIKVKEETPVFTVLEPVNVPVEKSGPKRKLILLLSIFLGGITGVGVVLVRLIAKPTTL